MCDNSPWKPPAPGDPARVRSSPVEKGAAAAPAPAGEPPSPWSREAAEATSRLPVPPEESVALVDPPSAPGDPFLASPSGPSAVERPRLTETPFDPPPPPAPGPLSPPAPPPPPPGSPLIPPPHPAPSLIPDAASPSAPDPAPLSVPDRPQRVVVDPQPATTSELRGVKVMVFAAVAAVAVVAIGLSGVFAVRGLTSETSSGAATPEELGDALLDAIDGEDVLGVIDLLLPGERATLGEPLIETVSELQRLDVLASDLDLANIAGLDVVVTDRVVSVKSTNVGDIARVRLSADASVTLDGADVPIGDMITDNVPVDSLSELRSSRVIETDELDFKLTAVEDDGRWYFSAWYSVAEAAREGSGFTVPSEGVGALGAESVEAAVDRWFEQIEALDLRGMIQSLDPYEAGALQRYAPLFLPDVEAELAELEGFFEVTEYSVHFEGSGSSRTAFIDSMAAQIDDDGVLFKIGFVDGCSTVVVSVDGVDEDSSEFCGGDLALEETLGGVTIPSEVDTLARTVTEAFADMESVGLEMRERDGEWFLSPITTLSETWLKALRALDRDEIEAIVLAAPPAFEAAANEVFGTEGGPSILGEVFADMSGDLTEADGGWFEYDGDVSEDDGGGFDDSLDDASDEGSGGFDDDSDGSDGSGGFDDGSGDFDDDAGDTAVTDGDWSTVPPDVELGDDTSAGDADPISRCYELAVTEEAIACFNQVLADGEAEPWTVPTVLRFPECGLAEMVWTGAIYEASDEEFVAAITEGRPCFQTLVVTGEIEEWEMPYEVVNFECFENRNWYSTFDDAEYNVRVLDCLDL